MNCPLINDNANPTLGIILPTYKRNYFSSSMPSYASQTYKPKFYVVIQNSNRKNFNISLIQNMVNETVYHIWMQNWNSFFFLNLRFASVFPCDLILKYDDDQWPSDNNLQQNLVDNIRNKNIIIGLRGNTVPKSFCGYTSENFIKKEHHVEDHVAVPLLFRTSYLKLDARNQVFRIYGSEDVAISLNSNRLCNVSSVIVKMNLVQKQNDGKSQTKDKQIISNIEKEKDPNFDIFISSYCYLIRSGYVPRRWKDFQIPKKDYINITLEHKRLF